MNSGEYQKKFFESQKKYAQDNLHYQKTFSVVTIRQLISTLPGGKKILDVGCADGELLASFVKKHQIHGIDNAENLLKIARRKGLLTKICNLENKIPYPEAYFEVVVAHHVIEHIVDTDRFLSECNRVLKKNGTLILTFPNTATFVSMVLILFNLPAYFGAGYQSLHVRDFTLKTINKALENHGFKIRQKLGGQFLPFIDYGYWLSSRLSRICCQFVSDYSLIIKKVGNTSRNQKPPYNLGITGFNKLLNKIIIK